MQIRYVYQLIIIFPFVVFLNSCSSVDMFYDFAPTYTKWELDSYFDLTDEQEEWVEVRLEQHFNWHREVELEHYITFLREVQRRGGDGLTLQEIKKGKEQRLFENDIKAVAYGNLVGLLIEAIKDLKKEIDDLKSSK